MDKQKFEEDKPNLLATTEVHKGLKNVKSKKGQTKEEQEKLLERFGAYARREDPEITASSIDFSKPLDQQDETGEDNDVKKEVMKFPTCCYACGREGDA